MKEWIEPTALARLSLLRQTQEGQRVLLRSECFPVEFSALRDDAEFFYPFAFNTRLPATLLPTDYVERVYEIFTTNETAFHQLESELIDVGPAEMPNGTEVSALYTLYNIIIASAKYHGLLTGTRESVDLSVDDVFALLDSKKDDKRR